MGRRVPQGKGPGHYLVRSVKEGHWETSINTLDPDSRQIAVEEGRDGLAGLRDLVVVVIIKISRAQHARFAKV